MIVGAKVERFRVKDEQTGETEVRDTGVVMACSYIGTSWGMLVMREDGSLFDARHDYVRVVEIPGKKKPKPAEAP